MNKQLTALPVFVKLVGIAELYHIFGAEGVVVCGIAFVVLNSSASFRGKNFRWSFRNSLEKWL